MATTSALSRSFPARLVDRYLDVQDWSTARKVTLVMLVALPFHLAYLTFSHLVLRGAGNGVDATTFERLQLAWLLVVVAVLAVSWWAGRKGRDAPWTGLLLVVAYGTPIGVALHLTGTWSSAFVAFWLLALMLVTLFLGPRFGLVAVAYGMILVGAVSALELAAVLPYAPLFFDRRIDVIGTPAWASAQLALVLLIFLYYVTVLGFAAAARERAKRRLETALGELSEARGHLERANDLISRYVAAQVARHILAGDYDAISRHSRRRLTIFFSDVVGFTQLADTMEPEDLSRILNEYLSEMSAIAEQHGATVDKFIGDAVMAFFGAPGRSDDRQDALRGVRMALAMLERLAALRQKWKQEGFDETWDVRIGINTGQASVGEFGSQRRVDYTAIGRQVNLAARLQAAAAPGEILVSHPTWLLVRDAIPCVPRGEIQVKGFAQPVQVCAVDRAAAAAGAPPPLAAE